MTVDRMVEMAKLVGWYVLEDKTRFASFPFCASSPVRCVALRKCKFGSSHFLYEQYPAYAYKKRFLTEIKKNNEKFLARIRAAKGFEDVVAALDFCT